MGTIKLKNGKIIGDYNEPYIIAELGANHNGDMKLAEKMIIRAKEAGCDCVKFQSWSKDSVFSKKVYEDNYFLNDDYRNRDDYTLEQIVDKFSISEVQLFQMKLICDRVGIDFSSTPFSKNEVDFLVDKCDVPFIKIASMDLNNYPFLEYIAKKRSPIVLSVGLSDVSEVDEAIRTIEKVSNNEIIILHCISLYPPEMEDINLNYMKTLRAMYPDYPVGFSDHTIGVSIPLAAAALGACIIEKHFTLDKEMFGWDHKISADFEEIKTIANDSKRIQIALGTGRRILSNQETEKRDAFRRSIVAANDIKMGQMILEKDLDTKRPGTGLPPSYLPFIVGRIAKRDISFDEIISRDDI